MTHRSGTAKLLVAGTVSAWLLWRAVRRSRRYDFRGASVVITGGSRGLGLELARQLGREGAKLSLLARSQEELRSAELELRDQADVRTYRCDIRVRAEVDQAIADVIRDRGSLDVLVNNAGIIQVGPLENMEVEDYRESLAVHAWGPLFAVYASLPQMQKQKSGRIVNISSIGGLVAIPHLLPYTVGKFALTGFSEGLRTELAPYGIQVTTVAPGLMRTGSHINAFFRGNQQREYFWFSAASGNPLVSTSSRRAARKIIDACRYGKPRVIITMPAAILHLMNANVHGITAAGISAAARLLPSSVDSPRTGLKTGQESRTPLSRVFSWPADLKIESGHENVRN